MRVEFDNRVFTDPAVSQMDLLAVFRCCQSRHHAILDDDRPGSPAQTWLSSHAPSLVEELQLTIQIGLENEAIRPAGRTIRIHAKSETQAYDPFRLNPSEALPWLMAPVRIYVENAINDQSFLLSIATQFERKELESRKMRGELEFVHGGGNTLKAIVREALSDRLKCWFGFALFDSDAPLPSRRNKGMDSFRDELGQMQFRHHQLRRRAAENYLTQSQLNHWAGPKHMESNHSNWDALDAFFGLNSELQKHFRMRDGLSADEKEADAGGWRADFDAAYAAVSEGDKARLRSGFGTKIRDLFATTPPKGADTQIHREEFDPVIRTIFSLA
jgi:hypothetical protein